MTSTINKKTVGTWLRALLHWINEAWPFWLTILVTIIALMIVLKSKGSEPHIRLTGLALQLFGVATVAWGIYETRALFGRPSLYSVASDWFRRFPSPQGRTASATSNAALGAATSSARGYATANAPLNADVEARLQVLEENLRRANQRIDQMHQEMDHSFRAVTTSLKTEEATRQAEDELTRRKLETSETGGLHITIMGTLWLFFGVTLSTASLEISTWIQTWQTAAHMARQAAG